jgi:hypothetical protein
MNVTFYQTVFLTVTNDRTLNIDYFHILHQTNGVFVLINPISDLAVRE